MRVTMAGVFWTWAYAGLITLLVGLGCGGKYLPPGCMDPNDQLCEPAHARPFCCPNPSVCGTGPLDQGGNGCDDDQCCPSPVASDAGQ